MVMVRALLVSSRVSVTPMVGAVWVSHIPGVGVVGGGDVAGGVTVDGVGVVFGRCWFRVWVRARGVFGLCGHCWLACLLIPLVIIVWPFRAKGDIAGGFTAGVAAGFWCG